LRGGSWNNNQKNARVSARNDNNPNNWNDNIGFRLVAHVIHLGESPHRQCLVSSQTRAEVRKTAWLVPGRYDEEIFWWRWKEGEAGGRQGFVNRQCLSRLPRPYVFVIPGAD
jgi:hypothetical protein